MTPGWKLTFWIAAAALAFVEGVRGNFSVRVPLNLGWLALAVFVVPFAWDAGNAL
jgi:hypothetical protein